MNQVVWSKKSLKQLKKISESHRASIVSKVFLLKDFPECTNIKKLTNHQYEYRLRVGNYRVFFNFDNGIKIVKIEEVKKRNESTY